PSAPLLALLLLGGATGLHAQTATISGLITNEATGRPVTTAFVAAVDAEGREASTAVTTGEGRYRLSVDPGTYEITVSGIGYGRQVLQTVTLGAGEAIQADFAIP